jgi:hypothetical protein
MLGSVREFTADSEGKADCNTLKGNPGPCEQVPASGEAENRHCPSADQFWSIFVREGKLERYCKDHEDDCEDGGCSTGKTWKAQRSK